MEWNDPTTVYTSLPGSYDVSPWQLYLHQLTQRNKWLLRKRELGKRRDHIFQDVISCFIKPKLLILTMIFIHKINFSLKFQINNYGSFYHYFLLCAHRIVGSSAPSRILNLFIYCENESLKTIGEKSSKPFLFQRLWKINNRSSCSPDPTTNSETMNPN